MIWLENCVSVGLQHLLALHLEGAPSHETIVATRSVWVTVLKSWAIAWDQNLDEARLAKAFIALAAQSQRWPAPSQLKPLMPARIYKMALPEPNYPAEKAKANLAKIKQLLKGI